MLTAIIREEECIGCSRCIPACPVDAILGTNKYLHTILTDECIGCKLCVAPCPVDCIEMVEASSVINKHARALKAKQRYQRRQNRLKKAAQQQLPVYASAAEKKQTIQNNIQAALNRVQVKQHEFKAYEE